MLLLWVHGSQSRQERAQPMFLKLQSAAGSPGEPVKTQNQRIPWTEEPGRLKSIVTKSRTKLSDLAHTPLTFREILIHIQVHRNTTN